ncbi:MAG: XrtA system polysaccharide chain length determinant [Chakrabartia sp.]
MNSLYDEVKIALHNVWKRRWLALGVAWIVCLIGWLVVSMIPNRYESEARIFVQMQSLLPDKIGVTAGDQQRNVERVKRTLTSTVILEKVVRGTDLAQQVSSDRDVTEKAMGLRNKINVAVQEENLFKISAESNQGGLSNAQNAKMAKDIVQKLIDIFVEENLSGGRLETSDTLKFLDQQIAERETILRDAEAKRVAFEQKYMGLLPGVGSAAQRMEVARQELNQVDSSLMVAQSGLASISSQMASTPSSFTGPSSGASGGAAASLEAQIADAQARGWTDSHPDVIAMRSQLARARAAGGKRNTAGAVSSNPAFASLQAMQAEKQANVSALSARKQQLQSEMAQYSARRIEEPGVAAEQERLNRDYDVVKVQYDKLLADREDIRLRGQMQASTSAVKFRVLDPPSRPRTPSAPDRPLMLTGVLLAGLAAGVGAAFALSQLQTGFVTANRLAKVSGMTVLGTITEVLTPEQRGAGRRKHKLFAGGAAALASVYVLLLVVEMIQRSSVA